MSDDYWLGVDLGGTKILAGLFDDDMKLVTRAKHPTGSENGPEGVFERINEAVESVIREANIEPSRIRGMGFGVPGQIQPNTSKVIYAPNLQWRDIDVGPLLPATWGWPIYLENDVRMGTYGEFAHGVAVGAKHVFGIFAGTGVGGAFILNGEVYVGFNGNAGEVGHTILQWKNGTQLEDIAGRRNQLKRAKKILGDSPKRIRKTWKRIDFQRMKSSQLAELYHSGDPVAGQIVNEAARAIAAAIASVINLMSPEVIVLGGGVALALGEEFQADIWERVLKMALPGAADNVRFEAAALGDDSGIIGCASFARAQTRGGVPTVLTFDRQADSSPPPLNSTESSS